MLFIGSEHSICSNLTSWDDPDRVWDMSCHRFVKMMKETKFNHASTGFELTGAHKTLECKNCHEGLHFAETKRTCYSCHTDVHKGEFGYWLPPMSLDTSVVDLPIWFSGINKTRFPLLGPHAVSVLPIVSHYDLRTKNISVRRDMFGCHAVDYQGTQNPNHTFLQFFFGLYWVPPKITAPRWGGRRVRYTHLLHFP